MEHIIRRAIENDISGLCALERECFSSPWSEGAFSDSMKSDTTEFFVCEEHGDIIGYIGIVCLLDECSVTNICVSSDHRKKGVATALLDAAEKRAAGRGALAVFLEVRVSNYAAIALYEGRGYDSCGRRRNFYTKPTEDAFVYKKQL